MNFNTQSYLQITLLETLVCLRSGEIHAIVQVSSPESIVKLVRDIDFRSRCVAFALVNGGIMWVDWELIHIEVTLSKIQHTGLLQPPWRVIGFVLACLTRRSVAMVVATGRWVWV